MRVIKPTTVRSWAIVYPAARHSLNHWLELVAAAQWRSLADVRTVFRSADPVRVKSGRQVYVFNIAGNHFRLIAAIHFNMQTVFALRFMTHAEYSKNRWKDDL